MIQHDYPSVVHYAPDLLCDKTIMRIDRLYHLWVAIGLVLPAVTVGIVRGSWMGVLSGFLWGGMLRMFILGHIIWSINSFLHQMGSRYNAGDSHNRLGATYLGRVMAQQSFYVSHRPFGMAWYRLDIGFGALNCLSVLGQRRQSADARPDNGQTPRVGGRR
jgi:stearoyl-CoA desaturase (delta-9 desaturase)